MQQPLWICCDAPRGLPLNWTQDSHVFTVLRKQGESRYWFACLSSHWFLVQEGILYTATWWDWGSTIWHSKFTAYTLLKLFMHFFHFILSNLSFSKSTALKRETSRLYETAEHRENKQCFNIKEPRIYVPELNQISHINPAEIFPPTNSIKGSLSI